MMTVQEPGQRRVFAHELPDMYEQCDTWERRQVAAALRVCRLRFLGRWAGALLVIGALVLVPMLLLSGGFTPAAGIVSGVLGAVGVLFLVVGFPRLKKVICGRLVRCDRQICSVAVSGYGVLQEVRCAGTLPYDRMVTVVVFSYEIPAEVGFWLPPSYRSSN